MISHLLNYTTKILFRSNEGLLWGILFPFAFGIVYMFAFSGIISGTETFDPVPVATVFTGDVAESKEAFEDLGAVGDLIDGEVISDDIADDDMIIFVETEEGEIDELLSSGVITTAAFIANDGGTYNIDLRMSPIAANEVSTSIVYSVFNAFMRINDAYVSVYETAATSDNPPVALETVSENLDEIDSDTEFLVNSSIASEGVNMYSNFYYVALAYISIFFMSVGVNLVTLNEANYSTAALRETVSPVQKYKRFSTTFLVWLIPSLLVVYLLLGIYWAVDLPIGTDYLRIIGLMTLGVLVGLLLGTAVAGVLKANMNVLTGVSISVPLILGALSGLMSIEVKIQVDSILPWIRYVNPVSLVNDALYYLNHYPTYEQFNQNVMLLALYAVILFIITIVSIRRTDYESL